MSNGGAEMRYAAEAVLLDIEGTLSPISFVRDTLFAYSRERLQAYVVTHRDEADVSAVLEETVRLAGDKDPIAALMHWHDSDEKAGPLKTLQGLIWQDGYSAGAFRSPIYTDAVEALRRWKQAGLPLYIYSSGSTKAQHLFFTHSAHGDLTPLFSGHFDTGIGRKTDATAYARIAERIAVPPQSIVFFSDQPKELDAALGAGLSAVHVVKDDTAPSAGHARILDFSEIELGLASRA